MATLTDIARHTGYSVAAVSRVLNPRPDRKRKVSDLAAQKIRAAAETLGYEPNLAASCLRRGIKPELGIFLPPYRGSFMVDLTMGLVRIANASHYPLNFSFDLGPESYIRFLEQNHGQRNCGILTFSTFIHNEAARRIMVDYVQSGGRLLIFTSGNQIPVFPELSQPPPLVRIDDYAGGQAAANYLLQFNPEQLFCLCCIPLRRQGFIETAAVRGTEVTEIPESEEGYSLLLSQIQHCGGRAGIFCGADRMAVRVHTMLLRAGILPGEDIHLVGYDDQYPLSEMTPALTSVAQPYEELGEISMKMMLQMLKGESVKSITLLPRLVIRET